MVARVHQQLLAVKRLQCAFAAMDGEALSAPNQLISAKGNHATMVERVSREPDGSGVYVLKASRAQIVASMWTNVHHNRAWVEQLASMASAVLLAFARKVDED